MIEQLTREEEYLSSLKSTCLFIARKWRK